MGQQILNKTPFAAVALSVTTFNAVIDTIDVFGISTQTITTGTPTGTYLFYRSNSPNCDPARGLAAAIASTDWVAFVPSGAPANPAGAGATGLFELPQFCSRFYKVSYANSGGAGTYTLMVYGKGEV